MTDQAPIYKPKKTHKKKTSEHNFASAEATGPESAEAAIRTPENNGEIIKVIFGARDQVRNVIQPKMSVETKELTNEGVKQVNKYIDLINRHREIITNEEREYVLANAADVIAERNFRADEVESKQVKEAAEIMKRLFHYAPFPQLCFDGRFNQLLIFGFTAQMMGSSTQTPAGDSHDFKLKEDKSLFLDAGSSTAKQLDLNLMGDKNRNIKGYDKMHPVWDSHLGCAKREKMEKLRGPVKDRGLRQDVIRKKNMGWGD